MTSVKRLILGCLAAALVAGVAVGINQAVSNAAAARAGGEKPIRYVPDNLFGISFADETNAWAAGYYGTVLHSTDGGASWTRKPLPHTDLVRRIRFIDARNGWLVTHRGRILHTADGGGAWRVQHQAAETNLRDIAMADAATGWAVGHNATVLRTTDGGASWTAQTVPYPGRDAPRINGVVALDAQSALLVGEFGLLARTGNGGATWTLITSPEQATYTAVVADPSGEAVAVGLNGAVVRIAGNSARALANPVKLHLFDLVQDGAGAILAVGIGGGARIAGDTVTFLPFSRSADENLTWLGGVGRSAGGQPLAVGMSGLVSRFDPKSGQFTREKDWTR